MCHVLCADQVARILNLRAVLRACRSHTMHRLVLRSYAIVQLAQGAAGVSALLVCQLCQQAVIARPRVPTDSSASPPSDPNTDGAHLEPASARGAEAGVPDPCPPRVVAPEPAHLHPALRGPRCAPFGGGLVGSGLVGFKKTCLALWFLSHLGASSRPVWVDVSAPQPARRPSLRELPGALAVPSRACLLVPLARGTCRRYHRAVWPQGSGGHFGLCESVPEHLPGSQPLLLDAGAQGRRTPPARRATDHHAHRC
jgi:hypothetical protein